VNRLLTQNQQQFIYSRKASASQFLLKLIVKFFGLFEIDVFIRKPDYHYVPKYYGRSAHKQSDLKTLPLFGALAAEVVQSGRSSLYYDRLYTIYQLLFQVSSAIQPGQDINLAEVGVYKGGGSYFIASLADHLGMKATHHCFDTFEGHAAEDINTEIESAHRPHYFNDTSYEAVKEYLSRFDNVSVHKGRFQDTCHLIQDTQIHFVHLDMDIYEPTVFALKFFENKMAKGGAILLDDYGFTSCPGIEKAVKEFMSGNMGYFGMSLLTGQYVLIRLGD